MIHIQGSSCKALLFYNKNLFLKQLGNFNSCWFTLLTALFFYHIFCLVLYYYTTVIVHNILAYNLISSHIYFPSSDVSSFIKLICFYILLRGNKWPYTMSGHMLLTIFNIALRHHSRSEVDILDKI